MRERDEERRGGEGCGTGNSPGFENGTGNRRGRMGLYLTEAALFLVCISGILFFYRIRRCHLDVPLLLLWGAALLVLVPLLIRGEIRLYREEEQVKQMQEQRRREIRRQETQEGKRDDGRKE